MKKHFSILFAIFILFAFLPYTTSFAYGFIDKNASRSSVFNI